LISKLEKAPGDLDSRFALTKLQVDAHRYADAIESLLQLIAIDRNWNNKAAYQMLMEVFNKVGSSNELVVKSRKRLSKILF
jgi:putative thioredoxin